MKRYISRVLTSTVFCLLLSLSGTVFAQGPEDPSVDDPAVPVDGGLSLLLAAGAAYGARRVRRRRDAS